MLESRRCRMPTIGAAVGVVLGAGALAACDAAAGWRLAPAPTAEGGFPASTQVQVWQGRRAVVLHGVTLAADTLYGIPFQRPLACDSCLVAIPRARIDSLRTGNLERGGGLVVGLVSGLLLGFMTILSGLGD